MTGGELDAYLSECRELTLAEIRRLLPNDGRYREVLYDLMLEYPLRSAKALRPSLCIASCRALGGSLESVLRSAAIIELYHNAFLIHDDVEDGSDLRRGRPTLHRSHGIPVAVNVGDAMLALALEPLLDNMRLLGMGKALRILQVIAQMARESTEGQALELQWIRNRRWDLSDGDYLRMVYKKTSWYTFIAPILVGGMVGGAAPAQLSTLRKFAALLGIAFQIQDDILNLTAEAGAYGKEIAGDLWEGKHTLILMHALRAATSRERTRAQAILRKPRPQPGARRLALPEHLLPALVERGEITSAARDAIEAALRKRGGRAPKSEEDVAFLRSLIERSRSLPYAREVAQRFAHKAEKLLDGSEWLRPSVHSDLMRAVLGYVVQRDR